MTDTSISALAAAAIGTPDQGERAAAENLAGMQPPARVGMAASVLMQDPTYRAAFERTLDRNLSAIGRDAAVREMEAVAMRHFPAEGQAAAPSPPADAVPEGFEAGELREYIAPPEVASQISDPAAFGAAAQAAQSAGVPAPFFRQAMAEAGNRAHLLNDAAGYEAAVRDARATLGRMHGEASAAMIRDATIYFDALEEVQPALWDGIRLMCASPWAIAAAANLHRSGVKPRKT